MSRQKMSFLESPILQPEVEILLECARRGSLSRAAESLSISQATVSKGIAKLEKRLKSKLLSRGPRGMVFTSSGAHWLRVFEGLKASVSSGLQGEAVTRSVVFGLHQSLAMEVLPELLPRLRDVFPNTDFQFVFAPSIEIARKVAAQEIDFGLAVNPPRRQQMIIRKIKTDQVSIYRSEAKQKSGSFLALLVHPDMIYSARVQREIASLTEVIQIQDYEVIAEIVKANPEYGGVLPHGIARRHGLHREGEPLFQVQISLVSHEDRIERSWIGKLEKETKEAFESDERKWR